MHLRSSLTLLQAGILGILLVLALLAATHMRDKIAQDTTTNQPFCGVSTYATGADSLYREGKILWNSNGCGSCHNKNMIDDATAPALAGVEARWAAYPRADLYAWIRNSSALVAAKHERAQRLYADWNGSAMNRYPKLTDKDIEALLDYIEGQYPTDR